MKKLGELIKELRGNESLRDAGKRIGISHTYLNTVEAGFDRRSGKPVKPTPETLKLISHAYNYEYEELMKIAGYLDNDEDEVNDEREFQAFINDPELKRWHRELPKSKEEDLRKLKKMWEIIQGENKD